jgi:hypothetical protein
MKNLLSVLSTLICFGSFSQTEKPAIFLSQIEMTPSGGQPYDEFYWFNSNNASLSKSVSFPVTGSYRFDLSAYLTSGSPSVKLIIDGISKGTLSVTNTSIAIYSLFINSISAGTHTIIIQLNNFSSGANHCRVGLLYFTQTSTTTPYIYPTIRPLAFVKGQILQANHFGSGRLRGFSLGGNGTNQPTENANSMIAMKATGANIARCFVNIVRPLTSNTYQLNTGELAKLDTTIARAARLGFYVVPCLELDPSFNNGQGDIDLWGPTSLGVAQGRGSNYVARRASVVALWQFLANRYKGNPAVAAYDLWNEPRILFNYALYLKWQQQIIEAIRVIDPVHVIAVECINNDMFAMMLPLPYTNIIYSPHGYSPLSITHQGVFSGENMVRTKYPTQAFGKSDLSKQHNNVRIMSQRFHVPVFVGEFSCVNWAPLNDAGQWTSTTWINDNISLLEHEGWSWVYHNWNRGGEAIEWDPEIPSSYYNSMSFSDATPSSKATKSAESSTAPTIVMLKKWFLLNDFSITDSNVSPTVSISSPANNTSYDAPASIIINAKASDSDGTISKVDFYSGNTLLGSDNTSPYSFTWNNVAAGNYFLTARATDNGSLVKISSPVSISVANPNAAPTVSIIYPETNTTFTNSSTVIIVAEASDPDGNITKVEFLNRASHLYTRYAPPYRCTLTNPKVGNYEISAKVTDNKGLSTQSYVVKISVVAPNVAPAISITSLINNDKLNVLATTTISASNTLSDGDSSQNKTAVNNRNILSVKLGPNPVNNVLSVFVQGIEKNRDLKISILSINGITIKSINSNTLTSVKPVDVSNLNAGMYLVQAISGDKIIYEKFVKQ